MDPSISISIYLSIYPSTCTIPSPIRISSLRWPATPTSSTSSLVRMTIYESMSIYIYPSIHLSIHPSTYLSIHPFIHSLPRRRHPCLDGSPHRPHIHLFGAHGLTRNRYPSMSIHPSTYLSIHPSVHVLPRRGHPCLNGPPHRPHLHIFWCAGPSINICPSIHLYLYIHLSIYLSIYLSIFLYIPFPVKDILVSMARHTDLIYIFFDTQDYL